MRWTSLISTQNLKLAWRRINTGSNLQYKRYFRSAYLVYESALDEQIKDLHKKLEKQVWRPQYATRVYLPKPSGLQRPISLLEIEDQIVLQGIANLFAKKMYKKRQSVELETVFSNKLSSPKDSIFFMEKWQTTYGGFQKKCIDIFDRGWRWAAHFDLAAYYDTISHDILLSNISDINLKNNVKKWLQIWSANNIAGMKGHGIPQGPIASDFLAEVFFLPIDIKMPKQSYAYLRYVDDIRLFGENENMVREAAIELEQKCRHLGLIPQSTKFHIKKITSPEDAMGNFPSMPTGNTQDSNGNNLSLQKAREIFKTAVGGRPLCIKDKSRLRFVLYRAPKDVRILNTIIKILPNHPEHIDAFMAYFSNYTKSKKLKNAAIHYLKERLPYSYARGELWHLIARMASCEEMRQLLDFARKEAKKRRGCVALSWGVMHFLIKSEEKGLISIGRRLNTEHPISRSLLAPIFHDKEFKRNGHILMLLKGNLMEQMASARELQKRLINLKEIGLEQKELKNTCRNALKALGVIKRRDTRNKHDYINDILKRIYGCNDFKKWDEVFNTEYEHALQILIETDARYEGAYSEWLGLQDSFNDIVVRKFILFLKKNNIKGHSKTIGKDGKLVKYGTLLVINGCLAKAFPDMTKKFRVIHERRNKLPGSHPYDEKGGSKNKWLTKKERNEIRISIKEAFNDMIKYISKHIE